VRNTETRCYRLTIFFLEAVYSVQCLVSLSTVCEISESQKERMRERERGEEERKIDSVRNRGGWRERDVRGLSCVCDNSSVLKDYTPSLSLSPPPFLSLALRLPLSSFLSFFFISLLIFHFSLLSHPLLFFLIQHFLYDLLISVFSSRYVSVSSVYNIVDALSSMSY
jgi:hypothetical protein